ncbi:glutathione S-transferase family protein [Flavisphingomonas formosensis]|uniref:glutathione S-transferase family protein n=1 Tax=Flavisphingomonas formosensis TaxID=861534 RepID=UPI0038CD6CD5
MTPEGKDVALTLFTLPGSRSLTSMIALEEADVPYEVIVPDVLAGDHLGNDYLALNPKGKIPTLLVDGHHSLKSLRYWHMSPIYSLTLASCRPPTSL